MLLKFSPPQIFACSFELYETVMVPKMKHLLQPLDLTTKGSLKEFEEKALSEYFSFTKMQVLKEGPDCDVTTIKVDV